MTRSRTGLRAPFPQPSPAPGGKIMILGPERVAYAGLLGVPTRRSFGCHTLYAALRTPLRLSIGDTCLETSGIAIVPPYTPHRVATADRMIGVLMIEPESVDPDRLPYSLQPGAPALLPTATPVAVQGIGERVRDTFLRLARGDFGRDLTGVDIDLLFFGRMLERRTLDARVAAIASRIVRHPYAQLSAEQAAQMTGLSFSRFLHLFRAEVGATYRGFRAWKRARSFLHYANGTPSLTELALEIGYPDSTHFSHSIRQVYGLRPRDIFAGSRDLAIVRQGGESMRAMQ
jgi:AraC-like DNA-binding protein